MKTKTMVLYPVLFMTGILLSSYQTARAGTWVGISPATYGTWKGFIILETGQTTMYQYTFCGIFGSSSECDWIPKVSLDAGLASENVFFSLDSQDCVTEKIWEVQHLEAGQTEYFSFTVYLSNPQLEPTLPGEYYELLAWWKPSLETSGGVTLQGQVGGVLFMQVTPEPGTLAFLGLGGLFLRNRRIGIRKNS